MMDLNFKRRRRDRAIARETAVQILRTLRGGDPTVAEAVVAHQFGLVSAKYNFDEAEARRVFLHVPGEMSRLRREIEKLAGKTATLAIGVEALAASAHGPVE